MAASSRVERSAGSAPEPLALSAGALCAVPLKNMIRACSARVLSIFKHHDLAFVRLGIFAVREHGAGIGAVYRTLAAQGRAVSLYDRKYNGTQPVGSLRKASVW